MAKEWEMPRRGEACDACRRVFEPGDVLQAFLFESAGGYERRDYCPKCAPPDEPAAIGSWRTRRPEPTTRKAPVFDREAAFGFFERLEDADTPEKRQLRFVLALLLWRRKVLKLDRSEQNGDSEVWHFQAPQSGLEYAVPRPDLGEDQLERLGAQLEGLLAGQPGGMDPLGPTRIEESPDG